MPALKKQLAALLFFFILTNISPKTYYQNFIQVYAEGPKGQYNAGFDVRTYTVEESSSLARSEMVEFVSGLIYGYRFNYRVENPFLGSAGYFELTPVAVIQRTDPRLTITQYEESPLTYRFLGLYRMVDDQKDYMNGVKSSLGAMSMGKAAGHYSESWENRMAVYREALKNAVFQHLKKEQKSRPLNVRGMIFLKDSPKVSIISGDWNVLVTVSLMIHEITYNDVY